MKQYIIYKTTNLANGKIYIGQHQTTNINDGYLGSGQRMLSAIKKYGRKQFHKEILFIFNNPEEMNAKEIEIVTEEFVSQDSNYNAQTGGITGKHAHTKETKAKISEAVSGEGNGMYGKKHNESTKLRMSESHANVTGDNNPMYGKKHNQSTLEKLRQPKKKLTCPHCGKFGGAGNMKRYHFDNCKIIS